MTSEQANKHVIKQATRHPNQLDGMATDGPPTANINGKQARKQTLPRPSMQQHNNTSTWHQQWQCNNVATSQQYNCTTTQQHGNNSGNATTQQCHIASMHVKFRHKPLRET
jgi:hypothetical protein